MEKNSTRRKPGIKQWIYCIVATILCILFVCWTRYYIVLIAILFFIDIYITRFLPWGCWRKIKNRRVRKFVEWVDAIIFALIGVYIINTFFFQNYQIPSSSLEKSLLVGDFLCVSKMSYGTRSPMTLFSFPLMQHTFPIFGCKSYLEKPQLKYQRFAGTGHLKRNDIVVFNYPSGDTVATKFQNEDYYQLCREVGHEFVKNNSTINLNNKDQNVEKNRYYMQIGRDIVKSDKNTFGDVIYRPVDRRENYVKRCIGLPGETIELKNDTVFIDGKPLEWPKNMELYYMIQTDGTRISNDVFDELGMSKEDKNSISSYDTKELGNTDSTTLAKEGLKYTAQNKGLIYDNVNLSRPMVEQLLKKPFVWRVIRRNGFLKEKGELDGNKVMQAEPIYPITYSKINCGYGDFTALWIPKKVATIRFDKNVDYKVAAYERCIKNYEHNDFAYQNGKVYINGKETTSYTFKLDYYFMMGDNRDNSADSRYWGFVPEDHIVGKPLFIWMSLDKDKSLFNGHIRWSRIFTTGNKK